MLKISCSALGTRTSFAFPPALSTQWMKRFCASLSTHWSRSAWNRSSGVSIFSHARGFCTACDSLSDCRTHSKVAAYV